MYFNFSALSFLHEFYKDTHKFCPDRAGCSYACNYQDSCQPVLLVVGKWASLQDCGDWQLSTDTDDELILQIDYWEHQHVAEDESTMIYPSILTHLSLVYNDNVACYYQNICVYFAVQDFLTCWPHSDLQCCLTVGGYSHQWECMLWLFWYNTLSTHLLPRTQYHLTLPTKDGWLGIWKQWQYRYYWERVVRAIYKLR